MKIEFYFDFSCPYAYVAAARIEKIAADGGAELVWRPMLLGGVFRSIGQPTVMTDGMSAAKLRHNACDMHRWAEVHGVPLRMPGNHPMRTVRALRALLSLGSSRWPAVIHGFYRAYWQGGGDISAVDTVRKVLRDAGVDRPDIDRAVAANDDPEIKAELRRRTDEAVSRGVFGAPAMFVHVPGNDRPYMFWGQDRLHMVSAVLGGWRPGENTPAAADKPDDTEAGKTAAEVHFWYDFSSPFAYLGSTQIERVAARAGARLIWRPMLLGAVFKQIGTDNVPLFTMPAAKRAYVGRDLGNWTSYLDVPFVFAKKFPQRTITALRLALLAGDRIAELSHALFRVIWVDGGDLEDRTTLARVLEDLGFDAESMLARTRDPEVKKLLIDNTSEAVSAGVFGAPTTVIKDPRGDLLFWGQDRLELVARALGGWRPEHG